MPVSEAVLILVREWIVKADHDLIAATQILKLGKALVPRRYRPTLDGAMQDRLTDYATTLRYPESGPDSSLTAARKAVTAARRVRREVRQKLPKSALLKKK
jgi:hypothetical protein